MQHAPRWPKINTPTTAGEPFNVMKTANDQQPKQNTINMKYTLSIILALAALLAVGCDQKKAAINEKTEATKDAIDTRKDQVNADAKEATKQADANAKLDKAKIEASKDATQAQLDADKKKADAEADAAKAKVDAENK